MYVVLLGGYTHLHQNVDCVTHKTPQQAARNLPERRQIIQTPGLILQAGDAAVWELLGYATRIWHIASNQLPVTPSEKLAADRIFSYWTSREAWLVSFCR